MNDEKAIHPGTGTDHSSTETNRSGTETDHRTGVAAGDRGRPDFIDPWPYTPDAPTASGAAGPPPHPPYPAGPAAGGPEPPGRPRTGSRRWLRWTVAGVGALALLTGAGGVGAAAALHYSDGGSSTLSAVQPARGVANDASGTSVSKVAEAVSPSVVSIAVRASGGGDEGSGVIVKSDGTILTNNHVIAAAAGGGGGGTITVTFDNGRTARADILGRDPSNDLAVIKARDVEKVKPATFGDSSALRAGDAVIAIGSPLGLDGSVTSGIVSAVHRDITLPAGQQDRMSDTPGGAAAGPSDATVVRAVQTDAAINPGNSGGPLLNSAGQVIGINTAIASAGGGSSGPEAGGGSASGGQSGSIGVGFAIPSDQAHDIAEQLISTGTATHAHLGAAVRDASSGAAVRRVESGGPADQAGLRSGDVVTKADGHRLSDAAGLVAYVRSERPGDTITLTYTRDGRQHTAHAELTGQTG